MVAIVDNDACVGAYMTRLAQLNDLTPQQSSPIAAARHTRTPRLCTYVFSATTSCVADASPTCPSGRTT